MPPAFPFSAIVGQAEMKRALTLAAIDPSIGGVLVFGDRGTGKSTAVRSLAALLPPIEIAKGSAYNSAPANGEDRETVPTPVIDLPLGATEDRVVGALDLERALTRGEKAFEPGLLARAHRGFLYIDEVNLLEDHIVDLLLDVAASGENVVEREGLSVRHPARFVLVGSGNPEEGELRPQLLDRFGLSVEVASPREIAERVEVIRRRDAFDRAPEGFLRKWSAADARHRRAILAARRRLPRVAAPDAALASCAALCIALGADGLRGELTLMRAARALAALEGAPAVSAAQLRAMAPSALRHRLRRDPLDEAGSSARVERALAEVLPRVTAGAPAWADAALAAALLAVAPALGGACLRARTGPAQAAWLELYLRLAPGGAPLRLPPGIGDDRLFGGLDLAATLAAGRPVTTPGLLAAAGTRALILPMAERIRPGLAARLGGALDANAGLTLIALDEGAEPDERAPDMLTDRLAFLPRLEPVSLAELAAAAPSPDDVAAARMRLPAVIVPPGTVESLATVALALGIDSLRAPLFALTAARSAAALAGTAAVDETAAAAAARLVFAPRARRLPETSPRPEPPEETGEPPDGSGPQDEGGQRIPEELLLEAARAAIPPDVVARLLGGGAFRGPAGRMQGAGGDRSSRSRGRPAGSMRGHPRDGARLDLIETLRAAAPWQKLRRASLGDDPGRVLVRADDFRVKRSKLRAEKVLIFAVDASGSTALARLAETKGAIELMLSQAYVARQQVALIAFRGAGAELLLPPTRSLVLTKRRLAGLPGGGGTPLAAGLDAALALSRLARARGVTPYLALLTDGRGNVALDGAPGRPQAEADAARLARACRAEGLAATVIDTGARPTPAARMLAEALGATYLPLPRADARALSGALTAALAGAA